MSGRFRPTRAFLPGILFIACASLPLAAQAPAGQKPAAETCHGIEGLLKEKKTFLRERPSDELVEFFNIGAGQKSERYEITSYEGLIDMADKLGLTDAVELLEQNLQEEEAALNKLKMIASEFDVAEEGEEEDEDTRTTGSRR